MAADIAAVREWVGSTPDDDAIETQWARFDGRDQQAELTALTILRARRADLVLGPDSWAVDGDYREAQGKAATLKALDADIARLERVTGDTAGGGFLTSAPIVASEGLR